MNKVCAAGTGSFVEEQAGRLQIALGDFGPLALSAEKPTELGERCTVFIKSQIEKKLGEGAAKSDIAAGICYSIVHNYLHKVVANKPVGENICFSGGLAYNDGIVAAFRNYYPSMQVTPYFSVTGALGIALQMRPCSRKTWRGRQRTGRGSPRTGVFFMARKSTTSAVMTVLRGRAERKALYRQL